MSRLFRRGELKSAVLEIVADIGPAHGYAVLAALGEQVGSSWRPSPGAVYPALIALEDAGLISGAAHDDSRVYSVTEAGQTKLAARPRVLVDVAERAVEREGSPTLGSLVDRFATEAPLRSARLDARAAAGATRILDRARADLTDLLATTEQQTKEQDHHG